MESNCVFRTLQANAAVFAALVAVAALAPAGATTLTPSQTFKAGTKIACVLDEAINSTTLKSGTDFKLKVVDTSHPALMNSEIHGVVTEVDQPSGTNRARIAFLLTSIHLPNGSKKMIVAYVVNKRVTPYNPVAVAQNKQQMMAAPPLPNGTVTPGPIAWQMRIGGGGSPSVSNRPTTTVGGYVYAATANEPIVVPQGQSVTIELQQDLKIP